MSRYAVAVDVGGTFTDVYARNLDTGEVVIRKVPSSPANPARAILDGVRATGIAGADIAGLTHGTTVGTNALVTRSFPRTALITTRGFRDVLEIGRSTKPHLWDAYVDVSPPYVRRRDRFEVTERIGADGRVLTPLAEDEVRDVARILRRRGIRGVGVCLINSYADDRHERRIVEILAEEAPELLVSASSVVLPEMFEFERTSTTATNAALGPVVEEYMDTLTAGLREYGFTGDVLVLHSGGGVMSAGTVRDFAARIAASGPAGGAVAMAHVAQRCGLTDAIGFDVGGTTSDVSVYTGGEVRITKDWGVEYGHPIAFPSVELVTIGAGGGSIAWVDDGGALRSGPHSAGADPGPAAYRRGGTLPTTTDANLVLGRLGTELVGGGMTMDVEAARAAIATHVAGPLGLGVEEAAAAILRIATANMTEAIRLVSIQRGLDPRDFGLVAFGGGGPLHGVEVAREAAVPVVVVPAHPGVTSAYGCTLVDIEHDVSRTHVARVEPATMAGLDEVFAALEAEGHARLEGERVHGRTEELRRSVDMRYEGQWRTLAVRLGDGPLDADLLAKLFRSEHERAFGYARTGDPVEVCAARVSAIARVAQPEVAPQVPAQAPAPVPHTHREVWDPRLGARARTAVYRRESLVPGTVLTGPAIVEQLDTTTWVPSDTTCTADPNGNLVLQIGDPA